ncbi:PD-(D/E)XK nuclease family protein [Candidatus Woesearchaeota archaeon]|nr:PD-(D/E)XK nuclease family protein [Candidatus Woesearchaeota archaeon]
MTTYSHSRLSTFEQCKYKYKLQYIDKAKVDTPTTIEAFMGDLVHRTLEKLYNDLKFQKLNELNELLNFFNQTWEKEYTDVILIAKSQYTAENYREMGIKYITDYYNQYHPFNQLTILGLETQDRLTLPDGNQYHVRIDKLACKDTTYYVCDYKTNSRMKDQEEADEDRQLAMYSIWVKDKFKDAKKVILLWHMLAFNKEAVSERTEELLKKLQEETFELIKEVEACKEFPTNVTKLCDYCVFKSMCPSFKHESELEEKQPKEFKEDEGVQFVDKYTKLQEEKKQIETELEQLKELMVQFAAQKGLDVIYGSNKKASVKAYDKVIYPENKEEFITLLKGRGLYEEFSMVCYAKLNSAILKENIDKEIIEKTTKDKDFRISISKRNETEE